MQHGKQIKASARNPRLVRVARPAEHGQAAPTGLLPLPESRDSFEPPEGENLRPSAWKADESGGRRAKTPRRGKGASVAESPPDNQDYQDFEQVPQPSVTDKPVDDPEQDRADNACDQHMNQDQQHVTPSRREPLERRH
jgi:hypothetical protein